VLTRCPTLQPRQVIADAEHPSEVELTGKVRFGGQMAHDHLERERKFDIPQDFQLPDIIATNGTDADDTRVETTTERLDATYYDTAGRHLQRAGITLRRRRGGHDDGWHLKLPAGDARIEVQLESRATSPPRELAELVQGIRFGQPLRPQVKLQTQRVRHQLLDGDADVLEVAVDDVTSTTMGDESVIDAWRELEVELGSAGDDTQLRALTRKLEKRGASPSAHESKYVHAIGPAPRRATPKRLRALIDGYLEAQREAIAHGDLRMRRNENVVHKTRVGVRRTRSTLHVFKDQFETERAATLDAELKWYAEVLGRVRDLDIIRESLLGQLDGLQDEFVLGSVRADLVSWLAKEREKAWKAIQTTLRSRRYRALLLEL
jgi:inorganic triphosphatase YgiF